MVFWILPSCCIVFVVVTILNPKQQLFVRAKINQNLIHIAIAQISPPVKDFAGFSSCPISLKAIHNKEIVSI